MDNALASALNLKQRLANDHAEMHGEIYAELAKITEQLVVQMEQLSDIEEMRETIETIQTDLVALAEELDLREYEEDPHSYSKRRRRSRRKKGPMVFFGAPSQQDLLMQQQAALNVFSDTMRN